MTYMPLIQLGFSYTLFTTKKCFSDKVSKHQNTKCDSVPSECLKVMFLYVSHQEFDRDNGNYKCHYHSHDQDHHLCSCERETEFQDFQKTGSEHDRDSQEKGKFCCYCTISTRAENPGFLTDSAGIARYICISVTGTKSSPGK